MFARMIQLSIKPGNREFAYRVADNAKRSMESLPGFQSVIFMREDKPEDGGDDIFAALSVWESREAAEAAGATLIPALQQQDNGYLTGPPTVTFHEVYEPKG
jgi:heme-degrading monooxygenase HmoA